MNMNQPEYSDKQQLADDVTVSPKTVRYLEGLASDTEQLFVKATEYRHLLNTAKTSLAREMYSKKLTKIVKKLDANMSVFSMLEDGAKRRAALATKSDEENSNIGGS